MDTRICTQEMMGTTVPIPPINTFSKETILSQLARGKPYYAASPVDLFSIEKFSLHHSSPSSVGRLDRFPGELLHIILDHLDARSFTRFSCVSIRANQLTESHFKFWRIVANAPDLFPVLSPHYSDAITLHSINTLYSCLTSSRCSSCDKYGAFIFLLTAERICKACLRHNPSYTTLRASNALQVLDLSPEQTQYLPTIKSLAKHLKNPIVAYTAEITPPRYSSLRLLQDLGIQAYGSQTSMEKNIASFIKRKQYSTNSSTKIPKVVSLGIMMQMSSYVHIFRTQLPDQPLSKDPLLGPPIPYDSDPLERYAVPFPSIINGKVEHGVWCRGCEYISVAGNKWEIHAEILDQLLPQPVPVNRFDYTKFATDYLGHLRDREMTEDELIEHAQECLWAPWVMETNWTIEKASRL